MAQGIVGNFGSFYEEIHRDIFKFCKAFDFEPTPQQAELFKILQHESTLPFDQRKKRIAAKSGQGPGKTAAIALAGMWRTARFLDAMTVVTAPTLRQAREVFLAECRRHLYKADPALQKLIKVTKSRVILAERPKWGIECATAIKAENVQGYHQERMTFIVEEASGVARPIIEQILGTLTNPDSLCCMIGNPNHCDCAFYDCFNSQRHEWHTLTFNAEESPIVDQMNVRRLREQFGKESDVYRVRVLGKFPRQDPSTVMSAEDLEDCTRTDPYKAALAGGQRMQFGLDFARYGSDESVVYQRMGYAVVKHKIFHKKDPNDVVFYAFTMQASTGWKDDKTEFVADAGGMGQGVMHHFHRAKKKIFEFHNQGRPSDSQYENIITEAFFIVAKLARAKAMYIPNDPILIQQLSTRQYYVNRRGKIQIESKDEYIKRTEKPSPDRADAFVMAFYEDLYAEGMVAGPDAGGKTVGVKWGG